MNEIIKADYDAIIRLFGSFGGEAANPEPDNPFIKLSTDDLLKEIKQFMKVADEK